MNGGDPGPIDFEGRLRDAVERVPGAIAASLVGLDGIPLAGHNIEASYEPPIADAEFATILSWAARTATSLDVGGLREFMFVTDGVTLVARMIGQEFFVSITLKSPALNLGIARVETQRIASQFEPSLVVS
jgi:predicted regulator of Ras-like GTPase activity (Roadblock/LC7/MglB family)